MDEMRAMLDDLMGKDRDLPQAERAKLKYVDKEREEEEKRCCQIPRDTQTQRTKICCVYVCVVVRGGGEVDSAEKQRKEP